MFFMLRHTIFKGRLGPSIDEFNIYQNRTVKASTQPVSWQMATNFGKLSLTEAEEKYLTDYETAAYLVVHNGKILFEKYWENYSDTSHTNSWSMAKSIVSHLIGCAIKEGLIKSVDDPIGNYLPEYRNEKVTIKNCLTMSTGFNFDESYINPFGYAARSLYGQNIEEVHKRYKVDHESGKYFDYQSANTQLLGFILNKVYGKTLSELANEKLWQPIGAEHDAFWSIYRENGPEKAFCCFNSNARDYAKFGLLYLNKGIVNGDTLIKSDYFEAATTPAKLEFQSGGDCRIYGYQWWCGNIDGGQLFYARGIQGQYIFVMPESNMVIVRLGRTEGPDNEVGHPNDVKKLIDIGRRMEKL